MASTVLGNLLRTNAAGSTNPSQTNKGILRAISTYISTNVTLSSVFSGALIAPPGTPLVAPDILKINSSPMLSYQLSFPRPSGGDGSAEWSVWMSSIYSAIRTCTIIGGASRPTGPVPAFSTLVRPTFSRSQLLSAQLSDYKNERDSVIDALARCIVSDLVKFFTPTFPSMYLTTHMGVSTVNSVIAIP
nr:MAG TPA: hypothetical protein [Caudoviricetes sp.]